MDSYVYEYITSHCRTEDSCSEMYGASWIFGGYLPGTWAFTLVWFFRIGACGPLCNGVGSGIEFGDCGIYFEDIRKYTKGKMWNLVRIKSPWNMDKD